MDEVSFIIGFVFTESGILSYWDLQIFKNIKIYLLPQTLQNVNSDMTTLLDSRSTLSS